MRPIDADALKQDLLKKGFYPAIVKCALKDAPTIKQPTWISVDEEKPKQRRTYFISYIFNDNEEVSFYGTAMFHPEEDANNGLVKGPHFSNEGVDGMRVTHWMPIPPKGVE